MEAQVETMDRQRFLVPSIVVGIVVILAVIGGMIATKKSGGNGGKGTAAASATAGGATAAKADEKKKKGDKEKKEKEPVPVAVEAVQITSISSYIAATANLVSENEVKVLAETDGRVSQLLVEEGQRVRKGQPLAVLAREDATISLNKANARANGARVAFERAKEMHAQQLMSRGDYERSAMEKEVAEQELAEAKWRLGKMTIRSPLDGVVSARGLRVGQQVAPTSEIFTITDHDPLIANIFLPEKDVIQLVNGRQVRLRLKADESVTFDGKIRQISPVVDIATGTVKITVEAVRPPAVVRPGTFVSVEIIRETRNSVPVLPREAVLRELRDAHVFVIDGEKAVKRAVTLGLEEGDFVEVRDGLKGGEKVVTAGQGGLKDGSPIKVLTDAKKQG